MKGGIGETETRGRGELETQRQEHWMVRRARTMPVDGLLHSPLFDVACMFIGAMQAMAHDLPWPPLKRDLLALLSAHKEAEEIVDQRRKAALNHQLSTNNSPQ